jgi:phosphomethylpyrimidine synthase
LSRRSFSEGGNFREGGCSVKITEDVRRYAAEQGMSEEVTIERALQKKAAEFAATGGDIYTKA